LFKKKKNQLDVAIDAVFEEMTIAGPDSEEYQKMIDHVERLSRIKAENKKLRVTHDTYAIVFGNLLGILIVIAYEQKHIFTTKAFSFTLKPKGH